MAYDPTSTDPTQNIFANGGNVIDAQTGQSTPVNSTILQPNAPIPFNSPNPTPVPDINGLNTPTLQPTGPEVQANDLSTRLESLNNSLVGKSQFTTEQQNAAGLPALNAQQTDLQSQLTNLKNQSAQIPLQLQNQAQGRGITAGGLAPIQTSQLRNNAIAALGVSTLLDATQGLISSANQKVQQAVSAKYDPIQEQIDAATKNLDLILKSPDYSLADKNRAQAQLDAQKNQQAQLDKNKEDAKTIQSWAAAAIANGATALQAQEILKIGQSDNPDLNAAFKLFAPFAKDPNAVQKAINELQAQRDAHNLSQAQQAQIYANIAKTAPGNLDPDTIQGWVTNIKNGTAKLSDIVSNPNLKNAVSTALSQTGTSASTILTTTQASLKELQDMVDNNNGFNAAVGYPGIVSNPTGFLTGGLLNHEIPGSPGANFLAKLKQVTNDVVLPNLTILHGLGRVTDREFQALQSAITSLGPNLSEDQFKTELANITQRINAAANGDNTSGILVSPDGKSQVNVSDLTPEQIQEAKTAGWK